MKIEIISDADYSFLKGVKLPIIVRGTPFYDSFLVTTKELRKAGVSFEGIYNDDYEWCFLDRFARKAEKARKESCFARFNNWLRNL